MGIERKVEWYEKLGYYEEAYKIYSQREKLESNVASRTEIQAKKIKCLNYFSEEAFFDELE